LYLLVSPTGSKWRRLKYRLAGKEKVLALGVYSEVTLAEARENQSADRKLIANGADPVEAKREKKRAAQACEEYLSV
jgi:Arm DNA-binding domain